MTAPGRRPLVAGNWKMHLDHFEAIAHAQRVAFSLRPAETDAVEVVLLPAFTALRSVQTVIDADELPIGFGAQDVSPHDSGAYTGDVSGPMLARLGCGYAVVGHSERRTVHGEDDELVAAKTRAAFRHGITPILCVGEHLDVRRAGDQHELVLRQLGAVLATLDVTALRALVVAYEPVWAIGTGAVASPEDAQDMAGVIRAALADRDAEAATTVRVLYGGSVKAGNAVELLGQPDVDGALVGGASLDAAEFVAIVRAALPVEAAG